VEKECGIFAPPDGWKYYEVLPGGIRRIWRNWEVPSRRGITGSPAVIQVPGYAEGGGPDIAVPATIRNISGGSVVKGRA
jgi:hypothetical protein